jgi:hypothetical protein
MASQRRPRRSSAGGVEVEVEVSSIISASTDREVV